MAAKTSPPPCDRSGVASTGATEELGTGAPEELGTEPQKNSYPTTTYYKRIKTKVKTKRRNSSTGK